MYQSTKGAHMANRRDAIVLGILGATALMAPPREALAEGCAEEFGAALLDKYMAAVNAHDTSAFPQIFTESYIQHSGRSASGLAAQIENFRRIVAAMPDVRMRVEDRIIAGDKLVA